MPEKSMNLINYNRFYFEINIIGIIERFNSLTLERIFFSEKKKDYLQNNICTTTVSFMKNMLWTECAAKLQVGN
jgi:hypothetical protein